MFEVEIWAYVRLPLPSSGFPFPPWLVIVVVFFNDNSSVFFEANEDDSPAEQASVFMEHIDSVFANLHLEVQKLHDNQIVISNFLKDSAASYDTRRE